MKNSYLLADCVIEHLVDAGFIYKREWKHRTNELYYTESFFIVGTRASTISFEIVVSEVCKITSSSLRTIEKRFLKDFNEIFINCGV